MYRLTRQARQDVLDIWSYIAEDNEAAADRFVDLLVHHFQMLGRNPYAGRRRDEVRDGYRSFAVGRYVVFFRIGDPGVQVMHVVHGSRDIESLLSE